MTRLLIVVVAGLSVGFVAAAWQAQRRGSGSVARLIKLADAPDEAIFSCPVGVDVSANSSSLGQCATLETAQSARALLEQMPEVSSANVAAPLVMGILDPTSTNGWGRVAIVYGSMGPGLARGEPKVVSGRLPDPDAADEVDVTESIARIAHVRIGDTVRLAGWTAADGNFDQAPDGPTFASRVVGVVRTVSDVSPERSDDLTGITAGDGIYVAGGWTASHGAGIFGYGWGVLVHIRGHAVDSFNDELRTRWADRYFQLADAVDTNLPALNRAVDTEGSAVGLVALIGGSAALAVFALVLNRQLRSEADDATVLSSLGATRLDVRTANAVSTLVIAVPTAVLASAVCIALSPLGPIGLARRAEPHVGLRFDWTVLLLTVAALVAVSLVVAALTSTLNRRGARNMRPGVFRTVGARHAGPVARAGFGFTAGARPWPAVVVTAAAIAAAVASAGVVRSFDRVETQPVRYGAWWDLAVGDYSDAETLQKGEDRVRADHDIDTAAVVKDEQATVDGRVTNVVSLDPIVGSIPPTVITGRLPTTTTEIALGQTVARRIKAEVGDEVTVQSLDNAGVTSTLEVVGIAIINDPTELDIGPGESGLVLKGALGSPQDFVGQTIEVRFAPSVSRADGQRGVLAAFDQFVAPTTPQNDIRNLRRVRAAPWLITGLLAVLAVASFGHAMVTIIRRRRKELAILAALGMTRRQIRSVPVVGSFALTMISLGAGTLAGVAAGRALWYAVIDRIGLGSGPVVAITPIVLVAVAAITLTGAVTLASHAVGHRRSSDDPLRTS